MKKLNDEGILLFESLLVVLLTVSLLMIPTVFSKTIIKEVEAQLFIEELQSSLTATQNYAVLSRNWTMMDISASTGKISFNILTEENHYLTHQLILPEIITTPTNKRFVFNGGSGNLQSFSTVYFDIDGVRHSLVFQLGSGRYHWN